MRNSPRRYSPLPSWLRYRAWLPQGAWLMVLLSMGCLSAQPWSGILSPTRAVNWQRANVGVSGGIPTNYTQCGATIAPYSGTDAKITNAIAACPANTFVLLGPGTFNVSSSIQILGQSNVVLRGSGPTSTTLAFSGAGAGGIFSAPIYIANIPAISVDAAATQPGGSNACNWTAGFAQGQTTITLTGCGSTGLVNGDILVLDQKNDTKDTGGMMTCDLEAGGIPCSATGQNTNNTGRYINGISWAQMQHVRVSSGCASACNGAGPYVLTISPGLYANNWGHLGAGTTGAYFLKPVNHVGIENLTIDATNCPDTADCQSGITFFDCDQCWRKNVTSINTRRNHTWNVNSTRNEIRDSYMFGVKNAASQSYGIENAPCDDCLIENNICQQVTACFMTAGEPGTIWGYNFSINHPVAAGYTYMQADYLSHSDDDYMALYEGNQIGGLFSDQLHGTSNVQTIFRNRIAGQDYNIFCSGCQPSNQTFPFDIDSYNRGYNIIGNVLGTNGYHTNYEAYGGTSVSRAVCNASIYEMGFGGGVCDSDPNGGVSDDTLVRSTLMRWGNYDVVTGGVRWNAAEGSPAAVQFLAANPTPATQTLPSSFYLAAKPAFFNVTSGVKAPFPPIGPDVSGGTGPGGFSYMIPAANCFFNIMRGPADGSGSVLSFDANSCYAAGQTVTLNPPTNLANVTN